MKYIQYLRSYAAIATGLILGGGTTVVLIKCTNMGIGSLLLAGMLVFSVTASGFMALTEECFGSVRIKDRREKPERKLQTFIIDGELQWVPSETCKGMEELRMVVAEK